MDLLFNQAALSGALENQERKLLAEVEAVPEDHLLHADDNAWAAALAEKYRVDVPVLDVAGRWLEEKETRIDVSGYPGRDIFRAGPIYVPGHEVQVHVPFTGEPDVFRFTPSSFTFNPPRARIEKGEVVQVITYPADAPRDVLALSNELIGDLEQWLEWARGDAEGTNSKLETAALRAIENRRSRVLTNKKRLEETGIPIGPPKRDHKTRITEVIVRRPSPVARRPDAPLELLPVLPTTRMSTFSK